MAYALKSSGQALDLVVCLIVEGGTVKDLCGNAVSKHANVTTSSATWKGVTREYLATSGSGDNAYGVTWTTPPTVSTLDADGMAVFMACAGSGTGSAANSHDFVTLASSAMSNRGLVRTSGGKGAMIIDSGATNNVGSTTIPTNGTTKFSLGANWKNDANCEIFYGPESGSLASDSTAGSPGNYGSSATKVRAIGTIPGGFGYQDYKPFVVAVFKSQRTLAQMQALHDDWFGELIDGGSATIALSPKPTSVTVGGTKTLTITRSTAAPAGGITYNLSSSAPAVATVPATVTMGEGQTTKTFDATGVSIGDAEITATNAADSGETDTAGLTVTAATVRTLQLLAHVDAVGATSVKGAVFAAPSGGALTGAKIGEFSGQAFDGTAVGGQARLRVAVSLFGGGSLTTSDTPVIVWTATSASSSALGDGVAFGSVGPQACTVVDV